MKHMLTRIFPKKKRPLRPQGAPRLSVPAFPRAIYAIGDVHGRLDLLERLEKRIARNAKRVDHNIWVVLLGDFVDRGPDSAGVIEYLLADHPSGFRRLCLGGNHEQAMLEALEDHRTLAWWCDNGGIETLQSYGIPPDRIDLSARGWPAMRALLDAHIPQAHRDFLAGLPLLLTVPGYAFVHAGLRPDIALPDQKDHDLRWYRGPTKGIHDAFGLTVVHGHTIVDKPLVTKDAIAIDTGACQTGRLTALRLVPGAKPAVYEQR